MSDQLLSILQNSAVHERVSAATLAALKERAQAAPHERFLSDAEYATLQAVVAVILPQQAVGTGVDIADAIDASLAEGKNAGWRLASLPADGEAYRKGLTTLAKMLEGTPFGTFDRMPVPAREGYLRCVANGDVDGPASFPLSAWLGMLKTDVVRTWITHPQVMEKMEFYGFADGATGTTNGPTANEGWSAITANTALPFEHGVVVPPAITGREA